jgi:hypothetical protein
MIEKFITKIMYRFGAASLMLWGKEKRANRFRADQGRGERKKNSRTIPEEVSEPSPRWLGRLC